MNRVQEAKELLEKIEKEAEDIVSEYRQKMVKAENSISADEMLEYIKENYIGKCYFITDTRNLILYTKFVDVVMVEDKDTKEKFPKIISSDIVFKDNTRNEFEICLGENCTLKNTRWLVDFSRRYADSFLIDESEYKKVLTESLSKIG